jgi:hypothetical protein
VKRQLDRIVLLALVWLAACVGASPNNSEVASQGGTAPQVTATAASYTTGQQIGVSWANLPTNPNDWIAIAPVNSDLSTVNAWTYTNGQAMGSATFASLPVGQYVARAFSNDSYDLLDESDPFDVTAGSGATLMTDAASYTISQNIAVSWTGLPGNANDWIALAPQGSADTSVIRYVYTGGQTSGTTTFTGGLSTAGPYVARAFINDTYEKAGEVAFTITGGPTGNVTTDKSSYSFDDQIVVSWSNLPGNATDWVSIAPAGSSDTTATRWIYTNGQTSGSFAFESPSTGGSYVARTYINDSYNKVGESAPFGIGVEVTTNKASYTTTEPVTVNWQNFPTNASDWVAIAPAGSPLTTVTTWVYTNGVAMGSTVFGALPAGSYVARGFLDDSYVLLDESPAFTVTGVGTVTVTTDAAMYASGQDITVSWSGLPGNANDWIALAPQGSADTSVTLWVYTGGQVSGSTTFTGGLATAGSYVARAFEDDSYNRLGESTAFNVQ